MAASFSRTHATRVLLDDDPDILASATCPMCHTSATVSQSALEAHGDWRCVRCGQHWDARRLATVAAYAAWIVEHDRVGRQPTAPIAVASSRVLAGAAASASRATSADGAITDGRP